MAGYLHYIVQLLIGYWILARAWMSIRAFFASGMIGTVLLTAAADICMLTGFAMTRYKARCASSMASAAPEKIIRGIFARLIKKKDSCFEIIAQISAASGHPFVNRG